MEKIYIILFICYMTYVYNRKCVAFSMSHMIEDGLDTRYGGLILSCQNIALSVSELLFGILSDRMDPTRLFQSGLVLIGMTSFLFSSSTSVPDFCIFWFCNGLAQGCGWPALAKILRQRADPKTFGTLWSFVSSSNNVAGCLSPFLTTFLAINFGWRFSISFAGATSIFLGVLLIFNDNSSSESQSNSVATEEKKEDNNTDSTIFSLLKNSFLWVLFLCFLVGYCAKCTLVDWGQHFIKQDRGLSYVHGTSFVSCVEIGGFLGRLFSGYLTDLFVRRAKQPNALLSHTPSYKIRMCVSLAFLIGGVLSLHAFRVILDKDSALMTTMVIGFCCGFCLYGLISISGIAASESAPSHLSGSAYALAALGGNVGATLSGFPICYLAENYNWTIVLVLLETIVGIAFALSVYVQKYQPTFECSEKEKKIE